MRYLIFKRDEHYEVYIDGKFFCSADTEAEAKNEVMKQLSKLK
jgi:hypothetical protein